MKQNVFCVFLMSLCLSGTFINGTTSQKNVDSEYEWLPVNFYGTLEDAEHNVNKVENISISGEYRNITFYIKPKNLSRDPVANYEKINLQDIAEIQLVNTPSESLYTFKRKDYIEVLVIFRSTRSSKKYIIERNKKITCYILESGAPVLKLVRFDSLFSLKIEGFKEQKEGAYGPLKTQECSQTKSEIAIDK